MRYEFINPLIQFGSVSWDLCVFDEDTLLIRTSCTFPEDVADDTLQKYADNLLGQYIIDNNRPAGIVIPMEVYRPSL